MKANRIKNILTVFTTISHNYQRVNHCQTYAHVYHVTAQLFCKVLVGLLAITANYCCVAMFCSLQTTTRAKAASDILVSQLYPNYPNKILLRGSR